MGSQDYRRSANGLVKGGPGGIKGDSKVWRKTNVAPLVTFVGSPSGNARRSPRTFTRVLRSPIVERREVNKLNGRTGTETKCKTLVRTNGSKDGTIEGC